MRQDRSKPASVSCGGADGLSPPPWACRAPQLFKFTGETSTVRTLTLSIATAALATAGVALAAPGTGGHRMPQGDVTRAQAQATAAERFAKMDVNSDGRLDRADREARRLQMFEWMDADNDGSISKAEFAAMHAQRGDGAREGRRAGADGHHMRGKRSGHRGAGMMARMADTNNDGAISQAEFTAAALKRFDRADADGNGTVTQAERTAARAAMKDQMQARWQERRAARQAAQPTN